MLYLHNRRFYALLASYILFAFFTFSCATASSSVKKNEIPDWVLDVPPSDARVEYFTASGTGSTTALAEENAKNNLVNEVVRMLGVSIKTNATAALFGSVNNVEKTVEQEIQQSAHATIRNLKIKKRYIEKNDAAATIYLLAEYGKDELEKEKIRLLKLAEERTNSVAIPAAAAAQFDSEGKYFAACYHYIQASSAAHTAQLENAEIKFKENINKAKQSLKKFKLTYNGSNFISSESGKFLPPIRIHCFEEHIPISVIYAVKPEQAGLPQKFFTETIESGENNIAEFILPVQETACSGTITFEVDIDEMCKMLKKTNIVFAEKAGSELKKITSQKNISINYKIEHNKKQKEEKKVSVDVSIEQSGGNQKHNASLETGAALIENLQKMNCTAKKIHSNHSQAEFIISGRIIADEIDASQTGFFVKLTAEIEIYRNTPNERMYARTISKRGAGFSEAEAYTSASHSLAKQIALEFTDCRQN